MNGPELDGLIRTRCQRNGCTAEVLVGHSRQGAPVVLDVRAERRAVLQRLVLEDPQTGLAMGIGRRLEFHDTYLPHRYSCRARDLVDGEVEGADVAAPQNGGSAT